MSEIIDKKVNKNVSLKKQGGELAGVNKQLEVLSGEPFSNGELPTFAK